MSMKFVGEFIQDCINKGIVNTVDIKNEAESEIKEIDKEIKKIDDLKSRQKKLRAVVKNLGGEPKKSEKVMDFTTPEEHLDANFKDLCIKICDEIEQSYPKGVPASRIIHELASLEDHKIGYSAIKWLGSRQIISRDENRLIIMGPDWKKRPNVNKI